MAICLPVHRSLAENRKRSARKWKLRADCLILPHSFDAAYFPRRIDILGLDIRMHRSSSHSPPFKVICLPVRRELDVYRNGS